MPKVGTLKSPEDYNGPDYLYWTPKLINKLTSRERPWVSKMVTVACWQVVFEGIGMKDKFGETVWACRKFGYVRELNKYVPEEELHG